MPYTTLNGLCNNGKTSIAKCSTETVYKLTKALDISTEELLRKEEVCVIYTIDELQDRIVTKRGVKPLPSDIGI